MKVKVYNSSNNALPSYATSGSAGMDLRADIGMATTIRPLERKLFQTGIHLELPEGYEARVQPRSGLALKHGITVLNTPGCIDADFRDNIGVILVNLSNEPYTVIPGERIAQLIISKFEHVEFEVVNSKNDLSETERGDGAYGHSGRM